VSVFRRLPDHFEADFDHAVDGDTLILWVREADGVKVQRRCRLRGVDSHEPTGAEAHAAADVAAKINALLTGEKLTVEMIPNNCDKYGRQLIRAQWRGADLGEILIKNGWSWPFGIADRIKHALRGQRLADVATAKTLAHSIAIAIVFFLGVGCSSDIFKQQTTTAAAAALATAVEISRGSDTTRAAVEQPPVTVNASGTNNRVDLTVTPNTTHMTATTSSGAEVTENRSDNSADASTFTQGQKLLLLALGVFAFALVVIWLWRRFKLAQPGTAAALGALATVADAAAARGIQNLRLKLAAAETTAEEIAYAHAIGEMEAARGKTAGAAPAMTPR